MTTQPTVITARDVIDGWRQAAALLLDQGDRFNLIIHITDPASTSEGDLARYDPRQEDAKTKSVYDVANTIFPRMRRPIAGGFEKFCDHFIPIYARGERRHPTAWGVYFLRLVSWGRDRRNQLAPILTALQTWKSRPRAAFVLHLSSADLDRPRTLGAPCLQYVEFLRNEDKTISLTAVYRSHDYFSKALGNFAGLNRLLQFVCTETGMTAGTLSCVSVYSSLQGKTRQTRDLVNR